MTEITSDYMYTIHGERSIYICCLRICTTPNQSPQAFAPFLFESYRTETYPPFDFPSTARANSPNPPTYPSRRHHYIEVFSAEHDYPARIHRLVFSQPLPGISKQQRHGFGISPVSTNCDRQLSELVHSPLRWHHGQSACSFCVAKQWQRSRRR